MRGTPRPEPVGEADKVHLVYGVEHLDHGPLEDLVLQGRDAERALAPVGFRDVHPARRLRPVAPCVQPPVQVLKVGLQVLAVVCPRHPIHSRSRLGAQFLVGGAQARKVDVVQESGEPCILVPSCCFAHTVQPA
jgi:hypothetical protein